MENSFETKEETVAFLHEMLEWLGPAKEKIENTSCRDFSNCQCDERTTGSRGQLI